MTEKIIEIRTRMAEPVCIPDYSDYERRLQYIELRERLLELRYNHNHDEKGRFCSGGGGGRMSSSSEKKLYSNGGANSEKSVDKSKKDDKINSDEISATGTNSLKKKGFPNKQKLNNHWQNGRTHKDEYISDGIITKEQYEKRGVQLAECAADGKKILGYKTKEGHICRYDVVKNDYVKADINKGLRTLFKPDEGIKYYNEMKNKEGINDE